MAKVLNNIAMRGLSGTLGRNFMIRQMRDGSTILCAKPDFSNRTFSQDQLSHQSRFQRAAAYARQAAKTMPIYAERAKGTLKTAYNIALADWFHPPVIHAVERRDGRIRVKATDNVLVDRVLITISDEAGKVLEQAQATQVDGSWWEYASGTEGKVRAEAWDLAGNIATQEKL